APLPRDRAAGPEPIGGRTAALLVGGPRPALPDRRAAQAGLRPARDRGLSRQPRLRPALRGATPAGRVEEATGAARTAPGPTDGHPRHARPGPRADGGGPH